MEHPADRFAIRHRGDAAGPLHYFLNLRQKTPRMVERRSQPIPNAAKRAATNGRQHSFYLSSYIQSCDWKRLHAACATAAVSCPSMCSARASAISPRKLRAPVQVVRGNRFDWRFDCCFLMNLSS